MRSTCGNARVLKARSYTRTKSDPSANRKFCGRSPWSLRRPTCPFPSRAEVHLRGNLQAHTTSRTTRPSVHCETYPRSPIRDVTGTRPMLGVGRCNQKSAVCTQNGYISIKTRVEGTYSERILPTAETLPPKTGMLRATRFTTIHAILHSRRSLGQVSFPSGAASHVLLRSPHSKKAFEIQPDHPKAFLPVSSQSTRCNRARGEEAPLPPSHNIE